MNAIACFPTRFPTGLPPIVAQQRLAPPKQQRARLDRAYWPTIAERSRHESLRDLAAEYGVSHETIRAVVRRSGSAAWATAAADRCLAAVLARAAGAVAAPLTTRAATLGFTETVPELCQGEQVATPGQRG